MMRAALVLGCVCWLAACHSADSVSNAPDITRVADVKSSFGPGFHVKDITKTGINPKMLAASKLPPGLKFEPAECSKFVLGQDIPPGLQGNMAAEVAEGEGNRFITIAVQTSRPVPFNEPGPNCRRVGFSGGPVRGVIEVINAPDIDGARTLGVHRVVQTAARGKPHTGELYNYSAHFADYQVIVTAVPLAASDQPVAPVDTNRARGLLIRAVAAVRG